MCKGHYKKIMSSSLFMMSNLSSVSNELSGLGISIVSVIG